MLVGGLVCQLIFWTFGRDMVFCIANPIQKAVQNCMYVTTTCSKGRRCSFFRSPENRTYNMFDPGCDGERWSTLVENSRKYLKLAFKNELRERYSEWRQQHDKDVEDKVRAIYEKNHRPGTGVLTDYGIQLSDQAMKQSREDARAKLLALNVEVAAAWEWWVREGYDRSMKRSRLEDSLGANGLGMGNGCGGGTCSFKIRKFVCHRQ